MTIKNGSQISIEFTLKLDDGSEIASNVDGEALVITHGNSEILPALEQELVGMDEGDTKIVKLEPSQAFGDKQMNAFESVPIDKIPEDARNVGAMLLINRPDGNQDQVRVHDIKDNEIIIDFNHPLAGENLTFEVKILSVQ
jgi:FKBP-type peptidyl-prolyl cis-trans isomerase 2